MTYAQQIISALTLMGLVTALSWRVRFWCFVRVVTCAFFASVCGWISLALIWSYMHGRDPDYHLGTSLTAATLLFLWFMLVDAFEHIKGGKK